LNQRHIPQKLDAIVVVTKQECYKKSFGTSLAAAVTRLYVVDGKYCFAEIRFWYAVIIYVNLVSILVPLYFQLML